MHCHSCVPPRRTLCTAPLTSDCSWRQAIISPAPPPLRPHPPPRPCPHRPGAAPQRPGAGPPGSPCPSPPAPAPGACPGSVAPGGERNEGARGREGWDKCVGVVPIPGLIACVAVRPWTRRSRRWVRGRGRRTIASGGSCSGAERGGGYKLLQPRTPLLPCWRQAVGC